MAAKELPCKISDLSVSLRGKGILHGISFELGRGEPFAIVGKSGSGKTTLLYALTGLLEPASGSVTYGGKPVLSLDPSERAGVYGLVFQDYQLFPHLTAMDNLMLAPRLRKLAIGEEKAASLLEELGLGGLGGRYPSELSGGQKQRVAIARSLLLEPSYLFLDEPSAALDERSSEDLAKLLKRLNERSQVVAVSHDRAFLEHLAGRGIRMEEGKIAKHGSLRDLFS